MLQVLASWTLLKAEKRSIDLESCVVLQSTFAAVRREKKGRGVCSAEICNRSVHYFALLFFL